MPTITVKNIPGDLYERLKQSAAAHHRSINSEIIVCIERAVQSSSIDLQTILAQARASRAKTASYTLTDEEILQAKAAGRP
ncbi:MAG: Arc family DNA-binding protein [Chloroflexi bacterium]|nr:Arc family DNA-binding protein [Chloroflexota bacterium]